MIWALQHLHDAGAATLRQPYALHLGMLLQHNRAWLGDDAADRHASYLMGQTGIRLLAQRLAPTPGNARQLQSLIEGNVDNPTRELLWGAVGTTLAALFLHRQSGEARWAELFRQGAQRLWSQRLWSHRHECHYWTQDMYGSTSSYLGAGHGFASLAMALILGRHLLDAAAWADWQACIENTARQSALREAGLANWPAWLIETTDTPPRMLMQWCHGAPGFVVGLAELPGSALDELLIAAGEAVWQAGQLDKGSNLCHGTAGNGYAFLKLYARTGDAIWLQRARAFAMHGIEQCEAAHSAHGQRRYSLWTGDLGLAVYLWSCVQAGAAFPTLDYFFGVQ